MIIALIILLFLAMLFIPGMGYLVGQLIKWSIVVVVFFGILMALGAMASMAGIQ